MDWKMILEGDKEVYERYSRDLLSLDHEVRRCFTSKANVLVSGTQEYCIYHSYCPCQLLSDSALPSCGYASVIRFLSMRMKHDM